MHLRQRLAALLLSAALLVPALPAARAAKNDITGTISGTVRLDLPQNLSSLKQRNFQVELFHDSRSLGVLPLNRTDDGIRLGDYPATTTLRNSDGGDLGGGNWPGYLNFSVKNLPQGAYTLEFTGDGCTPYTQQVDLGKFSQHVTLGTGDSTLTLGDVDADGRVTSRDREQLAEALASEKQQDLEQYDLNGDGRIDIYDLAAVNRNLKASGQAEIRDTVLLEFPEDAVRLDNGVTVLSGNLNDLLWDNGNTVTLSAADGPVGFSVALDEAVEMEQIQIFSPEGPGEILEGTVKVTYDDGSEEKVSFDNSTPANVHAISAEPGSGVVTIKLGRRVPVKEITITVTRAEGGGFVVVESIQFIQDIVPENPVQSNSEIRGLTAVPGDERVNLRWTALPNISGYRVDYWLKDASEAKKSLRVNVPQAEITGLENLKVYCFTVTPYDGSWEGKTSAVVEPSRSPQKRLMRPI